MSNLDIVNSIVSSIENSIKCDCDNSFDESTTYLSSSIEILYKGQPIGKVRYSASQELLEPSFLGDLNNPPESYESTISVDDIEIESLTNQHGKELENLKSKINHILTKKSISIWNI